MARPAKKYTTGQLAARAGLSRQQIREAIEAGALCPDPGTLGQGHGKAAIYNHGEVWVARVVAELRRYGVSWPTIGAVSGMLRPALVAGDRYLSTDAARRAYWTEYLRLDRQSRPLDDDYTAKRCVDLGVDLDDVKQPSTMAFDEFNALGRWIQTQEAFAGRSEQHALVCIAESDDGRWQVSFDSEPASRHGRFGSWLVVDLAVVLEGLR